MTGDRPKLTPEEGQASLRDHVADKAAEARDAFGAAIDYLAMLRLLQDGRFVRYPTRVGFDAAPLQPGEFAIAEPQGDSPADGFVIWVHPHFADDEADLPLLIAYHIVTVNYGEIATNEEAELYGATLLGLDVESYYQRLCALADSLPAS